MCHFQSSIWHLLLLFIQYVAPPFCDRFSWCVASFVLMCGASFGLVFRIFYTLRSVFFLYACSFTYPVVCRVFYSGSLLLTFSFLQLAPVFGNFLLYSSLFVRQCSRSKTLVFSSLFPRTLFFSRLLFSWHFKAMLKC